MFDQDGTYGPKANFKISLREIPDHGRFRVTVMAAKYDEGLLLARGSFAQEGSGAVTLKASAKPQPVTLPKSGVYQVDIHPAARIAPSSKPDASRLSQGLGGHWNIEGDPAGRLERVAKYMECSRPSVPR